MTLAPFLREQKITSRLQHNTLFTRNNNNNNNNNNNDNNNYYSSSSVDNYNNNYSLDKLLSGFVSSSGLLKMMEETGTISFSIAGAARKAQSDVHGGNAGQTRQFAAMMQDVGFTNVTSNGYTNTNCYSYTNINNNKNKRLLAAHGPVPLVLVQASQLRS